MSDPPILTVNWDRLAPILRAYATTLLGIVIGLWHMRAAQGLPLFRDWMHAITAVGGGLIIHVLVEYASAPPTRANRRRRRFQHLIAGYAYGTGGSNLVESVEQLRLFG